MKIFLVRHGESAELHPGEESQLTAQGKEESAKNALIFKQLHHTISVIYHSTKIRAQQTAFIFHEILGHHIKMEAKEGLKPNDDPKILVKELPSFQDSLMIVSHLPFLERVASLMLYGDERELPFTFEGSCVVTLEKGSKHWQLVSLIASEKSLQLQPRSL